MLRVPLLVKSAPNDGLVLELIKEVRLMLGGRELMGTNERGAALCATSWQLQAAVERLWNSRKIIESHLIYLFYRVVCYYKTLLTILSVLIKS